MTLSSWLLLCASMVVLAITPGPGMLAVIARSMSSGMAHGLMTTVGIVLGDFVFIFLVFFGMSAMASLLGELFKWVAILGGVYLIYLGVELIRSRPLNNVVEAIEEPSWAANCLAGLVITLSNPKAILFYAGFLPAFIDLSEASSSDLVLILVAALLAVGSSMAGYAYLAAKAGRRFQNSQTGVRIQQGAGVLLLGTGVYMMFR